LADCFCKTASGGGGAGEQKWTVIRENAVERSWKGRRNVDGGTGESGTAVDTMGAEVMETVDSWGKVSPSERGH